jgi:hypothetical protein
MICAKSGLIKSFYDSGEDLFVYSRLSNFSAIRRLSPLPMTGLKI